MTTGEIIKNARKRSGMTQAELGALLGVSGSMIGQWENNLRHPKLETRSRIADALGLKDYELATIYNPNKKHHRELEKMMGMEEGYLDHKKPTEFGEMGKNLQSIKECLENMNLDGQAEAVKRIKELTQLREYQKMPSPSLSDLWGFDKRQPPHEPPASPSDSTNTPPAGNTATELSEDK